MINIPQIPAINESVIEQAQQRHSRLAKPSGSLGKLEMLSIRLAGMTGRTDWFPAKRAIFLFAGDHGIAQSEPDTQSTANRVQQVLDERGAVNSPSRQFGARIIVVDAGVNFQFKSRPRNLVPPIGQEMRKPTFVQRKIASGTNDFTQVPAMTAQQADRSMLLGMDAIKEEQKRGLDIIFLGDLSSGNRLSAQAIITALTGQPLEGLSEHKMQIIQQALDLHQPVSEETLMKVGAYEIGAIAGAILQAASQRLPIVLDGLACAAGALIAYQLNPDIKQYLIAAQKTADIGHQQALDYLGLDPLLDLNIKLGDGTGALLAFPLIESAMRILNEMGTHHAG